MVAVHFLLFCIAMCEQCDVSYVGLQENRCAAGQRARPHSVRLING